MLPSCFEMKKQELGRSLLPPEELNVPGNSVNRLAAVYLLEPFFFIAAVLDELEALSCQLFFIQATA